MNRAICKYVVTPIMVGLVSTPALAGEWQGGVVGVTIGHDQTESKTSFASPLAIPIGPIQTEPFRSSDVTLGGLVGVRWRTGGIILGAELDAAVNLDSGGGGAAPVYLVRPEWRGSLRAVAGVPLGQVLVFGTVGVAKAKVGYFHAPGGPLAAQSHDVNPTGLTAGVGVELAAGDFRPRLEYRHTSYSRSQTSLNSVLYNDDLSSDNFTLGLLFKF